MYLTLFNIIEIVPISIVFSKSNRKFDRFGQLQNLFFRKQKKNKEKKKAEKKKAKLELLGENADEGDGPIDFGSD